MARTKKPMNKSGLDRTLSPLSPTDAGSQPGPSGYGKLGKRKGTAPIRRSPGISLGAIAKKSPTKRRKGRGVKVLAEIRKYQRTADLLIPKLPFCRIVKEILQSPMYGGGPEYRMQSQAIMALQEAAETLLVEMFENLNLAAYHAGRITIMPKDVHFLHRLGLVMKPGFIQIAN